MMNPVSTVRTPERSGRRKQDRKTNKLSQNQLLLTAIPIVWLLLVVLVGRVHTPEVLIRNKYHTALVPFGAIQDHHRTELPVTSRGPALHAESTTTCAGTARIREIPNQPSQRSRSDSVTDDDHAVPDFDFRDEYLNSNIVDYDKSRFTEEFIVYEQGQKEIIVKNRLREHIKFWENIGANQFILDTIKYGYKIPFYSLPSKSILKNNCSALKESEFVKEAINDLLDRGLIEKCSHIPIVVNPLSVSIQRNGKKRLILDLRTVNKHVWKQSIKYEDLRLAIMYLEKSGWMIKFDIHSAYHFLDIFYQDTEYLGFSFLNKNGELCYYKFLVLPFGLGVAPYLYTKFTRPLIAKWRGEGKKVIMFLDDGFATDATYASTEIVSNQIKQDLLDSGLIPKVDKSMWVPVQVLEWLGAILNTIDYTVSIPQRRIDKALSTLLEIKRFGRMPVRQVASFVGQIISMSIVIGPVSQIMTRYLSMDIAKAYSWNSFILLSDDSLEQLKFWEHTLGSINMRYLTLSGACSRIVYSDASGSAYAGYEVGTVNGVSHGTWSAEEAAKSSTWRELCAVFRVLKSLVHVLSNQRVKWFTDNKSVSIIVGKGSMKYDLQDLAMKIFNFTSVNSIQLEVEWIPRSENCRADYLSKIIESDDWSIGENIFEMIEGRWGKLEIDYFASEHNAKLPVFYSRFWCEHTSGVDAFTYDWSKSFGLFVPPVILAARVLRKMKHCRAKGILVVPEWKSANFWPLLTCKNGQFSLFVKDCLILPSNKESYRSCKNGSGIFGIENLRFRMLALFIDFTS